LKNEDNLWEEFPELVMMVKKDHIAQGFTGGGHDFLHALMTAQYAKKISGDMKIESLAWVAGLCHNTDRLFPKSIIRRLHHYLGKGTDFSRTEKSYIINAVLEHSLPNKPHDSILTIILKDADRLANIGPNIFIRSGQFYHKLPAYDPLYTSDPNPKATYSDPQTVLDDIKFCLEWEGWLRTPMAKELAKPHFELIRIFVNKFSDQLREVNLDSFPFK
jgi:hypothetical protein